MKLRKVLVQAEHATHLRSDGILPGGVQAAIHADANPGELPVPDHLDADMDQMPTGDQRPAEASAAAVPGERFQEHPAMRSDQSAVAESWDAKLHVVRLPPLRTSSKAGPIGSGETLAEAGGLILGTSDDLEHNMPLANIEVFLDACWREATAA
jgi:hypothetical protein